MGDRDPADGVGSDPHRPERHEALRTGVIAYRWDALRALRGSSQVVTFLSLRVLKQARSVAVQLKKICLFVLLPD